MNRVGTGLAAAAVLALCVASCGRESSTDAAGSQITDANRKTAKRMFETVCFTCHGTTGAGDGPGSKGLVPQPRNFQSSEWQASVSDEHIEKIIVGGGLAVGKAATMPANPILRAQPGVVAALREIVRSLKKPGAND